MRVHEVAKQLGVSSKECIARLTDLGVEVKNHMSSVEAAAVDLLIGEATGESAPASAPEEAAAEAAPVEVEAADAAEASAEPQASDEADSADAEDAPEGEPEIDDSKVIRVKGAVVVSQLAKSLGLRPNQLIAELMSMNVFASITEKVAVEIGKQIAEKHGFKLMHEKRTAEHRPTIQKAGEVEEKADAPEDLVTRPPVVTFLGHVDHGKTSLLDRIRSATVVDSEHGGITQHIGAYTVDSDGRQITFLDTPGHSAFTAMRARGANLTDIAVIIIACDDGIMPQTKEAIQHAQAAGVAMMVAINKIDLPGGNPEKVKQQLQADGLTPEEWGGEIVCCEVSAETGEGIDHLLEMILLQADVLELSANPKRRAGGHVVEASLEPGMGPKVNVLVTQGSLKIGNFVLCGSHCGKVRALINDHGVKVKSAGPSIPVTCLGLSGVPEAGAEFRVYANEKTARTLAQEATTDQKQEQLSAGRKVSLDNLFEQIEDEKAIELRIVLKADTQGSIEAIEHALDEIKSDKISLNTVLAGTGNITVNDVMLASASNAVVVGFHVGKEPGVDRTARHEGVEIRLHNVIYELFDEVRDSMSGLLSPELREAVMGLAEIRQTFSVGKGAKVAGCMVTQGTVTPKLRVRVRRGDEVLFEGNIQSLKHFQDSVGEVREAQECGIRLERFSDFDEGDLLEFYQLEEVEQSL